MDKKNISFPKSLEYISAKLGLQKFEFNIKTRLPFNGFYKGLMKTIEEPELYLKTYDKSILKPYLNKVNMMFYNDGISFPIQKKYQVGYDLLTNRITVPIWTMDGNLCGIMGRLNDFECDPKIRWLPLIPCQRSLTLSAYHRNYKTIQEKQLCIVGESDKFPMQLSSFNCNLGLATSTNHISSTQAKYLKGMMIKKIVLAYDEGLEQEYLEDQAKKLIIDTSIYKNKVGYIWDENNEILIQNKKQSPSDLGKEKFTYLMKNKVKWVN